MIAEDVKAKALQVLEDDGQVILNLIQNQKNHLCLAECPAFEEVVDTQMYGFSREIKYAIKLGVITEKQGHQLLSRLEQTLNLLYNEVYDEQSKITEE